MIATRDDIQRALRMWPGDHGVTLPKHDELFRVHGRLAVPDDRLEQRRGTPRAAPGGSSTTAKKQQISQDHARSPTAISPPKSLPSPYWTWALSDAAIGLRSMDPSSYLIALLPYAPERAQQLEKAKLSACKVALLLGSEHVPEQLRHCIVFAQTAVSTSDKRLLTQHKQLLSAHFKLTTTSSVTPSLSHVMVIVDDDSVCSSITFRTFLVVHRNGSELWVHVDWLVTADYARRKGCAARLFDSMVRCCITLANQYACKELWVITQSYKSAVPFWSHHLEVSAEAASMNLWLWSQLANGSFTDKKFPLYAECVDMCKRFDLRAMRLPA